MKNRRHLSDDWVKTESVSSLTNWEKQQAVLREKELSGNHYTEIYLRTSNEVVFKRVDWEALKFPE